MSYDSHLLLTISPRENSTDMILVTLPFLINQFKKGFGVNNFMIAGLKILFLFIKFYDSFD
jgi:hypothetical protein